MNPRFLKPDEAEKLKSYMNPVDYYNRNGDYVSIFYGNKKYETIDTHTAKALDCELFYTFSDSNKLTTGSDGNIYTLFELLTIIKFDSSYKDASNFVEYKILKTQIPYIRVGTDFFKVILKENRYGVIVKKVKAWKKETLTDDHGKAFIKEIPKFDDFCIYPSNIEYKEFYKNCYNLYAKFPHTPILGSSIKSDFHHIDLLMNHIFGDQVELGYIYMKVLYEYPAEILPILCLVSNERQTGKTTFLNLLDIVFGDNFVLISPSDLNSSFNHLYSTKNLIAIDETVVEKKEVVEKLKAIATQKTMTVNQKFVSQFSIPFYGKIVIATNMVKDFMRIDDEEIRFWVRKVPIINHKITNIEEKMITEVPSFLKFLLDMPKIDFTKSRMVFTPEEIRNEYLEDVQKESWSTLKKEIIELSENWFMNNEKATEFEATVKDIKDCWFPNNNNYSLAYIRKVLKEELKLIPASITTRYESFVRNSFSVGDTKIGKPFKFLKSELTVVEDEMPNENNNSDDVLPF